MRQRVITPRQRLGLIVVGQKQVGIGQDGLNAGQGRRRSGADHDIEHRHQSLPFRFPEERGEVIWLPPRHDQVAPDVKHAGTAEHREVNVREAEVRIGADRMEISPVLSLDVQNVGERSGMDGAAAHARDVNAEAGQILDYKIAQKVLPRFADHGDFAPQPPKASGRVDGTPAGAHQITVHKSELAGLRKPWDGAGENVRDQDSEADDVHDQATRSCAAATILSTEGT